jgi:hypothetical protein
MEMSKAGALMAGSQRSDHAKTFLPGERRTEWIADVAKSKLTDADLRFLARMQWEWCDGRTGETRWGADRMAAEIGVGKRQVMRYLEHARAAGFLRQTVKPAKDRQAQHTIAFDYKDRTPAAPQPVGHKPNPDEDWNDYTLNLQKRLNRAKDDAAVRRLWDSPAETELRNAMCDGHSHHQPFLAEMLEARLRDGKCEEVVPF